MLGRRGRICQTYRKKKVKKSSTKSNAICKEIKKKIYVNPKGKDDIKEKYDTRNISVRNGH